MQASDPSDPDPGNIVDLSRITLAYGTGPPVLRDLSLRLVEGSLHYLMGASGAGKSTLMRIIALELKPAAGNGTILGCRLDRLERRDVPRLRRQIGMVFQDCRLLPYLSVFDNVALPLRLAGRSEDTARRDVFAMLERVGLADRIQARPDTLSGGQQQRVAFARAAVIKPRLLLADEPTGNVDDDTGDRIMALFAELNRQGTTILIATHNPGLIERFPHPCYRLEGGSLHAPDQPTASTSAGRDGLTQSRLGRAIASEIAPREQRR